METKQLSIFSVLDSYGDEPQSNDDAYERLGHACGIDPKQWQHRVPIGHSGKAHSTLKRRVRWYQSPLKQLGLLEPCIPGIVQLGFSTEWGMALWADCRDALI